MDFGIEMNRRYYRNMKEFLKNLGVRVPINTSNLLGGAADVYGHTDAELMENNSYFNHPLLSLLGPQKYMVAGPMEYASVNPLTMQMGFGSLGTSLLSLGSEAAVYIIILLLYTLEKKIPGRLKKPQRRKTNKPLGIEIRAAVPF